MHSAQVRSVKGKLATGGLIFCGLGRAAVSDQFRAEYRGGTYTSYLYSDDKNVLLASATLLLGQLAQALLVHFGGFEGVCHAGPPSGFVFLHIDYP